jgi:hypothetical protein
LPAGVCVVFKKRNLKSDTFRIAHVAQHTAATCTDARAGLLCLIQIMMFMSNKRKQRVKVEREREGSDWLPRCLVRCFPICQLNVARGAKELDITCTYGA